MGNDKIECQECGRVLSDNQRPCPHCGSNKRNYYEEARVAIGISVSTEIKHRDKTGFLKFESKSRNKTSGRTKRRAQETIAIDRTDPNFTKKFHQVKEITEEGKADFVHAEEETYPAKRRPKKS
jgi:predicted  nucleic acid-binding Zn-ribbon protein